MSGNGRTLAVRCAIAGGGPCGMMLGLLLARAGVEIVVLEKHADFLRDFRGDTIHPSTLQLMHELGLLDRLLARPHDEARTLGGVIGETEITLADFSHLPTHCKFIAFMPQWDFLDFLAEEARTYPTFRLLMRTEAVGLVEREGRVVGLNAVTADGPLRIDADLVVGADGRHSTVRARAGLTSIDEGAPIDVLWMRLSRRDDDPTRTLGRIAPGGLLVTIDRGDYWQCAFVIPKGSFDALRARGIEALHAAIVRLAPYFADRVAELDDWSRVNLLSVQIDRLRQWYRPGLLCIGDAAHAMSPVGGVGINLAVQDAVAAANRLAGPLARGAVTLGDLRAVQRRREWAVRMTQRVQVLVQNRVALAALAHQGTIAVPLPVRLLQNYPVLRRLPARLIGMGLRPEHVRTPARP